MVMMRSAATGDGVMVSTAPRFGSTDVRPCGRECPCSLCILTAHRLQGGTANVQPASTSHDPFLTSPEGRPSSLLCVLCSAFSKTHQSASSEYMQAGITNSPFNKWETEAHQVQGLNHTVRSWQRWDQKQGSAVVPLCPCTL